MILVDTSVWADHLRNADKGLERLLNAGSVLMHPFVIGEIALGYLKKRAQILGDLATMPAAAVATHSEALALIENHSLDGSGLGYIDIHLLASARLSGATLWARDKRLRAAAAMLSLATTLP